MNIIVRGPNPTTLSKSEKEKIGSSEPWTGARRLDLDWTAARIKDDRGGFRLASINQSRAELVYLKDVIRQALQKIKQNESMSFESELSARFLRHLGAVEAVEERKDPLNRRQDKWARFIAHIDRQITALESAKASAQSISQGVYNFTLREAERRVATEFWRRQLLEKLANVRPMPGLFLATIARWTVLAGMFPTTLTVHGSTYNLCSVLYWRPEACCSYVAMIVNHGKSVVQMDGVDRGIADLHQEFVGLYIREECTPDLFKFDRAKAMLR
jgi:hypothetical protein